MKKSVIFGIGVVVLIIIGSLVFLKIGSDVRSSDTDDFDGFSKSLFLEDKFCEFSAEVYCASYKFSENEEANEEEFDEEILDLIDKYDYTQDEAYELIEDYTYDIEFQKSVLEKVKKLCPEAVSSFENNIEQLEQDMGSGSQESYQGSSGNCLEEAMTYRTFNGTRDAPCCGDLDKRYLDNRMSIGNDGKLVCTLSSTDVILCIDCGNGICGYGESPCQCPEDCGWCGDSICDSTSLEDYNSCPEDCENDYRDDCIMNGHRGGSYYVQGLDCCEGLEKKPAYDRSMISCEVSPIKNIFTCIDCNDVVCGKPINKCLCPEECS
ncbi:MAG: hypothetical protein ABH811_00750 [archaeon]